LNPFDPPAELDGDVGGESENSSNRSPRRFLWRWALTICFNAVVPMIFATAIVHPTAYWVMVLGLLLIFLAGALLWIRFPRVERPLLAGSYALGLTQLLPIPHVFAGVVAYRFLQAIGLSSTQDQVPNSELTSPVGVLFLTFTVAAMLGTVAIAFGATLILVIDRLKLPRKRVASPQ